MIKEFIEKNETKMLEDLALLVSHNSVYSDDLAPFGSENHKVLDDALGLMEEYGLKTTNLDYYCGYGEIGEGKDLIGILAHLDVVPAGEGWATDPFKMTEKDGVVYGRGVSDDKGAVIASLYALKYLKETNYPFKKRVRLITGCNEETGSKCIAHYVEKEGHIDMGFTPDGEFPGIFAEKGMVMGNIKCNSSKIINIKGGDASNIVCKKVRCELPLGSYDEADLHGFLRGHNIDYNMIKTDTSIILTVNGKAAHASLPDEGVNAISYLMEALYQAGFADELVDYYHDKFALNNHGELFGADKLTDEYTDFSMNIGVISKDANGITMSFDSRFPVTANVDEVEKLVRESLTLGNNHFETTTAVKPLFYDLDNPMIKALHKAYKDVTGDNETAMMAIGGGTYAKAINNCIAFGCQFLGKNGRIHDANECLEIEDLKKQVEIYVEAIKNLNEA